MTESFTWRGIQFSRKGGSWFSGCSWMVDKGRFGGFVASCFLFGNEYPETGEADSPIGALENARTNALEDFRKSIAMLEGMQS